MPSMNQFYVFISVLSFSKIAKLNGLPWEMQWANGKRRFQVYERLLLPGSRSSIGALTSRVYFNLLK